MKVHVKKVIDNELALTTSSAQTLYNQISKIDPGNLVISFEGIRRVSSLFLNNSIGLYIINFGTLEIDSIIIPKTDSLMKSKIEEVINNAANWEEYNHLVENASNNSF